MSSQFYWCGWEVPTSVPHEHMLETWPPGMQGWRTGFGEGYRTWAGAVWAVSEDEAWATVLKSYGPSADAIRTRWDPDPQGMLGDGLSDRFPDFDADALRAEAKAAGHE